jgi:hypothetical protein
MYVHLGLHLKSSGMEYALCTWVSFSSSRAMTPHSMRGTMHKSRLSYSLVEFQPWKQYEASSCCC